MHLWKISVNNQYTLIEQSSYDRDRDPTFITFCKYTLIKQSFQKLFVCYI